MRGISTVRIPKADNSFDFREAGGNGTKAHSLRELVYCYTALARRLEHVPTGHILISSIQSLLRYVDYLKRNTSGTPNTGLGRSTEGDTSHLYHCVEAFPRQGDRDEHGNFDLNLLANLQRLLA